MRFLSCFEARKLMAGAKRISLDLGLTEVEAPTDIDASMLKRIAEDEENVYFEDQGEWFKAMIVDQGHVYKLWPTGENKAPTHVINGIRMHVLTTSPYENAEAIARALNICKGERVLDICTGMGYSAIAAARRGAKVTSIEIDPNVIELMKINPWSQAAFELGVELIEGDAALVVPELGSFDAIIHDPPRFALAPQLYSTDFYKELAGHGRRMAHYCGNPGAKSGKSFLKGVAQRLREAGWKPAYNEPLQSFICERSRT